MKKKLLMLLTLMLFIPFVIKAEELKMDWQKSWGGSSNDYLYSMKPLEEDGFIAVGQIFSDDIEGLSKQGAAAAVIIKFDDGGNTIWQKIFGGDNYESFKEVYISNSGDFIAIGSYYVDGRTDAIIVKYDKNGDLLWQKSFGGTMADEFRKAIILDDESIITLCYSTSRDIEGLTYLGGTTDFNIIKYDKNGNLLWQKNWGGSGNDNIGSLVETNDGFIAVGSTDSTDIEGLEILGATDAVILKYDKNGNLLWQKNWGGSLSEKFNDIILTLNNELIITGNSNSKDVDGLSNKGAADSIIVKFDINGNLLWQKNWGGSGNDIFDKVIIDEYETYIVAGYSYSDDIPNLVSKDDDIKYYDAVLLKYDKDGNLLCQSSWGGNKDDSFNSISKTNDGKIIVTAKTSSDNIDGIIKQLNYEAAILKYLVKYNLENITSQNGTSTAIQQGKYGIITPTPNEGYEVDKIIIKDKGGNVLDVEVTNQEDGTYSFDLYTDVSVEVIYKEAIKNPKTGILDIITIIFIGFAISLSGFFIVKRYNERLEF